MSSDDVASRGSSSPAASIAAKILLDTVPVDRRSDVVLGLAQSLGSRGTDQDSLQHARLVVDLLSYCGQTKLGNHCLSDEQESIVIDHLVTYVLNSVAASARHDSFALRDVVQLCGGDRRLLSEVAAVCVDAVLNTRQSMMQDAMAFVVLPQVSLEQDSRQAHDVHAPSIDVRQAIICLKILSEFHHDLFEPHPQVEEALLDLVGAASVSYTHLTLPTKRIV